MRDAKGEWFYVLGCDDYIYKPYVMDEIVSSLDESVDACATTVRRQSRDGEGDWVALETAMNEIFTSPCVCHQGEIIRTDLVRQLGGFDERYSIAADSDLFFKAHLRNVRFRYIDKSFAYFAYGGVAISNLSEAMIQHRSSVATELGLEAADREMMVEREILPYHVLWSLKDHPDVAIRSSARTMIKERIRVIVRLVFYPLVLLARPIRNRKKE